MAKHIDSKIWQRPSQSGFRYSSPPADVTAPSAAILGTPAALSSSAIRAPITGVSVDIQSGVLDYIPHYATSLSGSYTTGQPIARDVAESIGVDVSGLSAGTTYYVYVTSRDLALNESVASNIVSATTQAAAANSSWWRNDPVMRVSWQQGPWTYLLSTDATIQQDHLRKDIVCVPQFYVNSTRIATRMSGLAWADVSNAPRIQQYFIPNEHMKTIPATPGQDAREYLTEAIASSTEGNTRWRARRANGDPVECEFSPSIAWQTNMATRVAGQNSHGEYLDQWLARKLDEEFSSGGYYDTYISGWAIDVLEHRCPQTYVNNGATAVSDIDVTGDGVAESRWLYDDSNLAQGRMWSEGTLALKTSLEARFPGALVIPNSGRWAYDYFSNPTQGKPPLPISEHPSYRMWEVTMQESVNNELGWARVPSTGSATGTYTKSNATGVSLLARRMAIQEKFLKPNSQIASHASGVGKGAVIMHAWMHNRDSGGNNAQPNATDRELHRFHLGLCMLMDRVACGINIHSRRAASLDEELLDFGNPVGTRSMGTLSESTLAWTDRTPDATNGTATMHCQRYGNIQVCVRTDTPPAGTALWDGSGTAVTFNLPTPPTGKKYRYFNSATYNPPNETFSMRNQDPGINTGSDTGATISLRYWTARFLEIVDA